ncbi:MAG: serine/threonine protein kinase [Gloeomargaritaceae cyanobacterium C42_A2020_066]|nr:serine/threonine protein kinase [Gloeomargaritaceae cyanobacterium C42_A2020_066]
MKKGQRLAGRYEVVKALGAGGFGKTYLARDIHRPGQPECVVKHLKPASQDSFFLEAARRLFHTEAETLEKLGQHPQIPQLLAYFEEDQEFYLVEEFIEGESLGQAIVPDKCWAEADAVRLLVDALEVLDAVHKAGVIHRDIKPDNLIRRASDHKLVLIDFGAVKAFEDPQAVEKLKTGMTVAVGTMGYAPSEQVSGKPQYSSDVYSLGVMVLSALTGRPADALTADPQTGEFTWRTLTPVPISHGLATVLDRMVRYHYSKRYQNAGEVLMALRTLGYWKAEGQSPAAASTGVVPPPCATQTSPRTSTRSVSRVSSLGAVAPWWANPVFIKMGLVGVALLGMMALLSQALKSGLEQTGRPADPTSPATEATASPSPSESVPPTPQNDRQTVEVRPGGTTTRAETIQAGSTHTYDFELGTEGELLVQVSGPGVQLSLFDSSGSLVSSSARNVPRWMDRLRPGSYSVEVTLPEGSKADYRLVMRLFPVDEGQPQSSPSPEAGGL